MEPKGPVVDLFSGVGCVAESLANVRPVITNDALAFTATLARARFLGLSRSLRIRDVIENIRTPYRDRSTALAAEYHGRLRDEQRAIDGGQASLLAYMADAEHVGNSAAVASKAKVSSMSAGPDRYCLATYYFSAGYFGLRQSIKIDALRFAIDEIAPEPGVDRDWLLAAWLATVAVVVSAPGHTAQYLKSNNINSYQRIRRYWQRNIWETFQDQLISLRLVGTATWRKCNRVLISDALDLLRGDLLGKVGAVYADPPYTKDQYSRYYHVYETLNAYDFPESSGEGRVRHDRFATGFCLKSGVTAAFRDLFELVGRLGVPLVLSYPTAGLLAAAGSSVLELAQSNFTVTAVESFGAEHSTLGAFQGSTTKTATENIYVFRPIKRRARRATRATSRSN
jgi:adenine-specific DNA-methyltransferase